MEYNKISKSGKGIVINGQTVDLDWSIGGIESPSVNLFKLSITIPQEYQETIEDSLCHRRIINNSSGNPINISLPGDDQFQDITMYLLDCYNINGNMIMQLTNDNFVINDKNEIVSRYELV